MMIAFAPSWSCPASCTSLAGPRSSIAVTSCTVRSSAPNRAACAVARRARSAPGEAHREAQVVLDPRALAGLAAGGLALDQRRPQPLRGAVDRGRQAGRPAADDHEVVELELGPPAHPGPLGELGHGRPPAGRRRRGTARAAARRRRRRRRAAAWPRRRARRRASGTAPGFGPGSRGRRATRATSGGRPPGCGRRRRAHPPARRRAGRPRPGRAAPRADPTASAGSDRATTRLIASIAACVSA